jgi:ABC-type uncharacterized transport system permease subunit
MHQPTTGQLALLTVSIAFFVVGGVISLTRVSFERPWSRIAAKACMYLGLVTALGVLIWHSTARGNWLPLEDNFDTLIWIALVLAIFVLYVQRRKPLAGLDWFIMPIVVILLIGAGVMGLTRPHEYEAKGIWLTFHLATTFGGAAAFAIAAAGGTMYLIANYRLRHKIALAGPSFGSLERLEHLTMTAVTLGFAMLTIGAITGLMKMKFEHSPVPTTKVVLSAAVWVVYALVLHSPLNPSFRGRRAAVLSIVGGVLMVGTVITVMLLPSGT